jgi:hypothetical protein
MSSLQNDLQFSSSFQRTHISFHLFLDADIAPLGDQGQFLQFQCTPGVEYNFFSTPPSPEPLVPSHDTLPDFHTPTFYAFSATPSPTFEESLGLPSFPVSETTSEPATSSTFKSPSRLRSGNRVPRPRNAFMIFRSEFWAGEKISRSVEHDHRHISRIIGHCWNQLPDLEKDKWREKAEQEKLDHIMKYPGYRFSPNARTKKAVKRKVKRNNEEELLRCKQVAELLLAGKQGVELDSAVKGMKSPLDDTVLKDRGQESDNGGSSRRSRTLSPKNGEPPRKSNSPTFESSGHRPNLDHIDIPIFRSPLLPPAQTQQNVSPTHHQSLSVSMIITLLSTYLTLVLLVFPIRASSG